MTSTPGKLSPARKRQLRDQLQVELAKALVGSVSRLTEDFETHPDHFDLIFQVELRGDPVRWVVVGDLHVTSHKVREVEGTL